MEPHIKKALESMKVRREALLDEALVLEKQIVGLEALFAPGKNGSHLGHSSARRSRHNGTGKYDATAPSRSEEIRRLLKEKGPLTGDQIYAALSKGSRSWPRVKFNSLLAAMRSHDYIGRDPEMRWFHLRDPGEPVKKAPTLLAQN